MFLDSMDNVLIRTKSILNFGKFCAGTCTVLKNNTPYECKIYELEYDKDKQYFEKLETKKNWKNNSLIDCFDNHFNNNHEKKYFIIEDKTRQCICACILNKPDFDENYRIDYIETMPKYQGSSSGKSMKYIGEAMLAYIAKLAVLNNKNGIKIPAPLKQAQRFYQKCGFNSENWKDITLDKKQCKELIEKHQEHVEIVV